MSWVWPLVATALAAEAPPLPPGHPPTGGNAPPSAAELLKQLDGNPDVKNRDKTFEVAAALGKLYYGSFRYAEAADYLKQALDKAKPLRTLYLGQLKNAKAPLPGAGRSGCEPDPNRSLEDWTRLAQLKAQAKDAAAAAACARGGLEPTTEVEDMLARAMFHQHRPLLAIAEYDRALEVNEADAEARFGRASVRLDAQGDDLKALRWARQDFEALLQKSPNSARAPEARKLLARTEELIVGGGVTALAKKRAEERKAHPVQGASAPFAASASPAPSGSAGAPPLSKEMVDSVQNTERTPELAQGMAKLVEEGEEHLARGRYQEALDAYKRVVPFQPENARAKAGMAWALVGLGKPMADRVWTVAVGSDPAAVEKLGATLKAKGDPRGAEALWHKLAESDPSYAQKSGLATQLK